MATLAKKDKAQETKASLLLEAVPWPEKQFKPASGGLECYAEAYSRAAGVLAGNPQIGGTESLPIVFLYRHSIELLVKAIIIDDSSRTRVCPQCVLNRSHDLNKQVPDLRTVAEWHEVTIDKTVYDLISAWDKKDQQGMKARYPVTKSGKHDPLENSTRFNLKKFVEDCTLAVSALQELYAIVEKSNYDDFLEAERITVES